MINLQQKQILDLLEVADEKTLMMSRQNCHTVGLHSIVLRNTDDRLTRLFICLTYHDLWKNDVLSLVEGNNAVGIHNHQYHLLLDRISGSAYNLLFNKNLNGNKFNKYRFINSIGSVAPPRIIQEDQEKLSLTNISIINHLHLMRTSLHTVFVKKYETASWLVTEGERLKDYTTLYSNNNHLIERIDRYSTLRYQPFKSAEEVKHLVKEFYK